MPGPGTFDSGKYAKYNPTMQLSYVSSLAEYGTVQKKDGKLYDRLQLSMIMANERKFDPEGTTPLSGNTFKEYFPSEKNKEIKALLDDTNKFYKKILENPKEDEKKFLGIFSYLETTSNTENGSFAEAVEDNTYIPTLLSQFHKSLKIEGKMPETGEDITLEFLAKPENMGNVLPYFNDFFEGISDVIKCEYKKLNLSANYDPGKEQEYLSDLSKAIKKTCDNFEKISELVDDNGKSKYDVFMNDPLTNIVGKGNLSIGNTAKRNCVDEIENLRGQQKAIENGWGFNELTVLGSINQLYSKLVQDGRQAEREYEAAVAGQDEYVKGMQEKVNKARERFEQIKNNPLPPETEEEKKDEKKHNAYLRSVSEYNNDYEQREKRLKEMEQALTEAPNRISEKKKTADEYARLKEELEKVRETAFATKVNGPVDKIKVAAAFNGFLEANKDTFVSNLGNEFKTHGNVLKNTASCGFKKPGVTEITEDYATHEDFKGHDALANYRMLPLGTMINSLDPEGYKEFIKGQDKLWDKVENGDLKRIERQGTLKSNFLPKIEYEIDEEIKKELTDFAKSQLRAGMIAINKADSATKSFKLYSKCSIVGSDVEKGNMLELENNDPYVAALISNNVAAGPDIFRSEKSKDKMVEPKEIRDYFTATGIMNPLMDFYGHGADLIETEYKRQKDMEKGWDAEKETVYLASVHEEYDKIIKANDELIKLSDETLRSTKTKDKIYTGNDLTELVGRGKENVDRGFDQYVEGLRWKKKAIENGWGSRDLQIMNLIGIFEGLIDHITYSYEFKGDVAGSVRLKEWKEKEFAPFKEEIWNKKINSPTDVIECIEKIEKFRDSLPKGKNFEYAYDSSFKMGLVAFKKCYNDCVSDAINGNSLYYSADVRRDEILKTSDESFSKKAMLEQIKNSKDLPKYAIEEMVAGYIYSDFLDGKSIVANPELFDEKHPDHKLTTSVLKKETGKYAREFMESLKTDSVTEIAEILGSKVHSAAMSDIADRVKATVANKNLLDFVKEVNKDRKDISVENTLKVMKAAETFTTNSRFGDVMKGIPEIDKTLKKFAKKINDDLAAGKSAKIPKKEMEALAAKQKEIAGKIASYLKDKDEIIIKAGGDPKNPKDISRLGKTGEKRYLAMQQAKKTFLALRKMINEFENKGVQYTYDRLTLAHADEGYKLDGDYIRQAAIREKFKAVDDKAKEITVNEEKYRQAEAEKYYKLGKQREKEFADKKYDAAEYERIKAEDKKEYEEKIVNSAKRVLYTETLRASYTATADKNMLDNASYENSMKNINAYKKAVEEVFLEKGSKQFEKFEDSVLNATQPFLKPFTEEVIKASEKKPLRTSEFIKIRDNIVQKCIDEAPTKELKDLYKKHSGVLGKGACELNYGKLKDKRNAKEEKLEAGKEVNKDETIKKQSKKDKTLK